MSPGLRVFYYQPHTIPGTKVGSRKFQESLLQSVGFTEAQERQYCPRYKKIKTSSQNNSLWEIRSIVLPLLTTGFLNIQIRKEKISLTEFLRRYPLPRILYQSIQIINKILFSVFKIIFFSFLKSQIPISFFESLFLVFFFK